MSERVGFSLLKIQHVFGIFTLPKPKLMKLLRTDSTDKDFIKDQKENPQNYRYKIIHVFMKRSDAVLLEIKLHNKFNVNINESFYNRSKQTSVGFDVTGTTHSISVKLKISDSLIGKTKGRVKTEEHRTKISNTLRGHVQSEQTRLKKSESHKGKVHSEETKMKMSSAKKGIRKEIVICPHCDKEGGAGNMKRYHFDNCKFKDKK